MLIFKDFLFYIVKTKEIKLIFFLLNYLIDVLTSKK